MGYMIGTLYRYSHPSDPSTWLYVGQGVGRDRAHRSGKSSFGRRFKRKFPNVELPQPTREQFEVSNSEELNALETFWIHCYKTWHEDGGMNLSLPGTSDYKNIGRMASREDKIRAGILGGKANIASGWALKLGQESVESGHLSLSTTKETRSKGGQKGGPRRFELWGSPRTIEGSRKGGLTQGPISGRKAVLSGQLKSVASLGGKIGGPIGGKKKSPAKTAACQQNAIVGRHTRWHVKRGIINPNCKLCSEGTIR